MRIYPHREDPGTAPHLPAPLRDSAAGSIDLFHRLARLEIENSALREILCDLLRTRLAAHTFES